MLIGKGIQTAEDYRDKWNQFARDVLQVKLDKEQEEILHSIQTSRRVSVRSGNARGKDYVAAVASVCFLVTYAPSRVINTAPTGRQVQSIMMAEIAKIIRNSKIELGLEVLSNQIKVYWQDVLQKEWYLLAFKASDKASEAWTGFHSPNIMVVVTEATGILQETYNSIESILTGNSKLLLVFNPNHATGESYQSTKSPEYKHFHLNCLKAPNVVAKKILYPGQVDYEWVNERVHKPGWTTKIMRQDALKDMGDFEWEGEWYRPNDLFRIKVQGLYPLESETKLIPLAWIEAANMRWDDMQEQRSEIRKEQALKLGVDVAGLGRDMTVFCRRYGSWVDGFSYFTKRDNMEIAGEIQGELKRDIDTAYIDAIGEGAGVVSRLKELEARVCGVKASEGAKNLRDFTNEREFLNMRAYLYWALRDALDPQFGATLALPRNDMLIQDLNEPEFARRRSDGKIVIEDKEAIKKRLGRSPDFGDALSMTFYPGEPEVGSWDGVFASGATQEESGW